MSLARRSSKAAARMPKHRLFFLSNLSIDLSALQATAKALERSLDSLGFCLFVFTALVVVGLIAEYRHDVVDFWEEVRRPAAMFPWPKFWAIAGGILVTGGVAGELIVGIRASRKESDLRTFSHQIEALLTDKASKNEMEAAQLRKEAEDEAFARATLEAEFVKEEPRFTLLRWRRPYITGKLKRFCGQRFTSLNESGHTDTEAIRASSELTVILEYDAKWVNNIPHGSFGPGNVSGSGLVVRILPSATAETRRAASVLFKTLREVLISGVQFADNGQDIKRILPTIPFDEQTVLIEVGEHPTPLSPPHAKENTEKIKTPSK
jgi:hypothetical protein